MSVRGVGGGGGGAGSGISGLSAGAGTSNANVTGLTFANSNNITFGLSTGANVGTITASFAGAGNAGISALSAGAGTSNSNVTGLTFANSNGFTFGLSTGASLGTITASYNTTSNVGLNTAQTNVTWTVNSSGLSINAAGYAGTTTAITGNASITLNSAGLQFNGSNLAGVGTSITGNASITVNSAGIQFNGSGLAGTTTAITGGASITLNSAGLQFNGSALAGTATAITGGALITLNSTGLSFNGAGLAGTNTATTGPVSVTLNSSGISINAPATSSMVGVSGLSVATNGSTISVYPSAMTRLIWPYAQLSPVSAPNNAAASFVYVSLDWPIIASRVDALMSISMATSATTNTCAIAWSAYCAVYTRNAASLSSLSSGSTQTTLSLASNSAGQTQLSQAAIRPISVPVAISMTPGEYFVGFNWVTATSSIGLSTTNNGVTFSIMGGNQLQTAANYAESNAVTGASVNLYNGMGVYSASTTGLSGAYSISGIAATGASLSQANIALVFRNA